MKTAPIPPDESAKLSLIEHLEKLGSTPANIFDDLRRSLALVCDTPIALLSLVDEFRGLLKFDEGPYSSKEQSVASFCAQKILQDRTLVVPDTLSDERFAKHSLVIGAPNIRFYAGVPLTLAPATRLGTLCVIDYRPHVLQPNQLAVLELLASHTALVIGVLIDHAESTRDFSSLVLVKQKLQFQKELTEAILDHQPEGVIILSRNGDIEQINKAGLDLLNAGTLEVVRRRPLLDYVVLQFRDRFMECQAQVFGGGHAVLEHRVLSIEGPERWVQMHAAPLYDRQGQVVNLVAVMRDISAAKQLQQELSLAALAFSEAREGIIITDAKSVILDVNPAFCNITGYTREEVIGQTPAILQSGLQGPDFYAALWKVLLETGHWKGEIWSRKKNGELYAELLSITALRDASGKAVNYVALFFDLTDYRRERGEGPVPALVVPRSPTAED
jgi:PAS domain S-box-containing protein